MNLMPASEIFIREQCEALRGFVPFYVGWRRVKGLPLPPERVCVINRGTFASRSRSFLYRLTRYAPLVDRHLRATAPSLIHAQFEEGGIQAAPLAQALRIPLAVTFRGYDVAMHDSALRPNPVTNWIYRRGRARLQRHGSLFLGVSNFVRKKMIERGYPEERSIVHYNGVDLEKFRADPAIVRAPIILFAGRLVEKKGCEYVIRAAGEIQREVPDVEFVAIGEGPLRASLETLAKQLLRRSRFLGSISAEKVCAWMKSARVFSIGSVTAENGDSEGLPNVVVEAQAAGLPVVSFDHAGMSEAVLHGRNGFLSPEHDWRGMAQNFATLLRDSDCWERFAREGRRHAEAMFDREKQTRRLEDIYDRLIKGAA